MSDPGYASFLVRFWREPPASPDLPGACPEPLDLARDEQGERAQREWLVQVEHIPSGEKAYFTSLEDFFAFIQAQLAGPQRVRGAEEQGSTGV
ncbi:MAG: hypothetical protein ACE5F6_07190 [Anaerolineae bacterium]